jgi:hypothetical protein
MPYFYNIADLTETYGDVGNLALSTTAATVWTELTPTTSYSHRVNAITAANVTNISSLLTVSVNSAAAGGGTAYRLMFQVVVPPNSAIVVLDKSTPVYLNDTQSIVATASVAGVIELSAMYEVFTGASFSLTVGTSGVSATGSVGGVTGSRSKELVGNTATGTSGTMLPGFVVLDPVTAIGSVGSVAFLLGWQRTQQVIFGFGRTAGGVQNVTNLVSNTGVVATDTAGVGTARDALAAASYGGDKAIFGYGYTTAAVSLSNLVSNTGVVATDTTGVGTARYGLAAANYGGTNTTAAFAYGTTTAATGVSMKNLVSNAGVVAADVTGVGTGRWYLAAAPYGTTGQSAFAYGQTTPTAYSSLKNLMNASGTIATDVTGVGTARSQVTATKYGNYASGTSLFVGGFTGSAALTTVNLLSNTGVIATDTTQAAGTARNGAAASAFGGNTGNAIMAFGNSGGTLYNVSNIISSSGVFAADTTGVGTARSTLAAAGFSYT